MQKKKAKGQKKKVHHGSSHRTSAEIMQDMHGIARMARNSFVNGMNDMFTVLDYVARFKRGIKSKEWYENWHKEIYKHFDKWCNYEYTFEGLKEEVLKHGVKIDYEELTEEKCREMYAGNKYFQMIALRNLDTNNEQFYNNMALLGCATLALNDIGWKRETIMAFNRQFKDVYMNVLEKDTIKRITDMRLELMKEGFFYEPPVDSFDDPYFKKRMSI